MLWKWSTGQSFIFPKWLCYKIHTLEQSSKFRSILLKFVYFEKATKFCKISTLLLSTVHTDKKGKISQNFVVFSEYMNFNKFSNLKPSIEDWTLVQYFLSSIQFLVYDMIYFFERWWQQTSNVSQHISCVIPVTLFTRYNILFS